MAHADLICVPQLMTGEQALAAQTGGPVLGYQELSAPLAIPTAA